MKKFTFIAEYKKGTYISQYESSNLMEALVIWADNLDIQFRDNFYSPVSIEKVDNVWCSSYVIFRSLLLLNIVETV